MNQPLTPLHPEEILYSACTKVFNDRANWTCADAIAFRLLRNAIDYLQSQSK